MYWLKYFPLSLREITSSDDEINLSLSTKKHSYSLNIADNILSFKAPKHSFDASGEKLNYFMGLANGLRHFKRAGYSSKSNWQYCGVLHRKWQYKWPWFGRRSGAIGFSIGALRRNPEAPLSTASFFHPASFEYAITNYLSHDYGYGDLYDPDQKAPINWRVHKQHPMPCADFYKTPINPRHYVFFPIYDDTLIKIIFSYTGAVQQPLIEKMHKLTEEIIQSIEIQLSPEAQAANEKVKRENGGLTLSENFPPLKWPIDPKTLD